MRILCIRVTLWPLKFRNSYGVTWDTAVIKTMQLTNYSEEALPMIDITIARITHVEWVYQLERLLHKETTSASLPSCYATKILTWFRWITLKQLQVLCKSCGHKQYITRTLLGIEPRERGFLKKHGASLL